MKQQTVASCFMPLKAVKLTMLWCTLDLMLFSDVFMSKLWVISESRLRLQYCCQIAHQCTFCALPTSSSIWMSSKLLRWYFCLKQLVLPWSQTYVNTQRHMRKAMSTQVAAKERILSIFATRRNISTMLQEREQTKRNQYGCKGSSSEKPAPPYLSESTASVFSHPLEPCKNTDDTLSSCDE